VFVAGGTYGSGDFAVNRTVFGTPSNPDTADAFVVKLGNSLSVQEVPAGGFFADVSLLNGVLTVSLPNPSYVGYDLYSADGRLVKRVSLGYLPAGRYEYELKLPKGVYLLKVRVGNRVKEFKGAM